MIHQSPQNTIRSIRFNIIIYVQVQAHRMCASSGFQPSQGASNFDLFHLPSCCKFSWDANRAAAKLILRRFGSLGRGFHAWFISPRCGEVQLDPTRNDGIMPHLLRGWIAWSLTWKILEIWWHLFPIFLQRLTLWELVELYLYETMSPIEVDDFPEVEHDDFPVPNWYRTVGPFSIHLAYSETFFSSFSWWSSKVSHFRSAKLGSSPFLELVEGSSREKKPLTIIFHMIDHPATIDHHQPSTILSIFILTWKNDRTPDVCCTLSLQPMKSLSWCISKPFKKIWRPPRSSCSPRKNTWDVQGVSWYHFLVHKVV